MLNKTFFMQVLAATIAGLAVSYLTKEKVNDDGA